MIFTTARAAREEGMRARRVSHATFRRVTRLVRSLSWLVAGALLVSLAPAPVEAADPCPGTATLWRFRQLAMHDPLVAEPHPDAVRLSFGSLSHYQYARSTGSRFGADLDVGAELPLVGCVKGSYTGRPTKGQYRIGIFIPVSFHMLWDLHDESSPIINNDYRFSYGMLKGIYGTGGGGRLPSQLEARWRVYAHESTHLGDELTIAAQDSVLRGGPRFDRVNVSYQFYEVSLGARWEDVGSIGSLSVRGGWTSLLGGAGFYGDSMTVTERLRGDTLGIHQLPVARSVASTEPFGRLELRYGLLLLGYDATRRIVLDYAVPPAVPHESRRWSHNLIVGVQDPGRTFGERGKVDIFLRYYDGANPHGQFRSQKRFRIVALGLFLPV